MRRGPPSPPPPRTVAVPGGRRGRSHVVCEPALVRTGAGVLEEGRAQILPKGLEGVRV